MWYSSALVTIVEKVSFQFLCWHDFAVLNIVKLVY